MSSTTRLDHLDVIRGLAALLVVVAHLRPFIFQGYAEIETVNLPVQAFYFATSLGNQAVT